MPTANKLTAHIVAAVAQDYAEQISDKTKTGLAAAKALGTKLGGFRAAAKLTPDARTKAIVNAAESHRATAADDDAGPHGHLLGHMSRANSRWRDVRGEVMAVFSGPHAYVSPSWYEEEGTVPTWNYVAVHAYGTLHVVEDRDALLDIHRRSVAAYESPLPEPWPFDESAGHVEKMLRAIVGFHIEITRLEGKWKLSQNQPEGRRRRVIGALSGRSDEDSQAVAAMMAEVTNKAGEDRGEPGADGRP